jgi:glucuronate isomerase
MRPNEYHAELYFKKALAGEPLSAKEQALLVTQLWRILGREYVRRGMALELRAGAAVLDNAPISAHVPTNYATLAALFDYLVSWQGLPRTALYLACPAEAPEGARLAARYPAMAEGQPQLRLGIVSGSPAQARERLQALANVAPLAHTLGSVPDARLYTSPLDADLFCRTLCSLLADWRERGELDVPDDRVYRLVTRACGGNLSDFLQL